MYKKNHFLFLMILLFSFPFVLTNAQQIKMQMKKSMVNSEVINKAVCIVYPTEGNSAHGIITFTKAKDGIKVAADIEGLKPGEHGFHIHEYGDCSSKDGMSAGGHFNPDNMPHAGPMVKMRHEGDMGNITADANGKVHFEWTDSHLSFEGKHSIIGRGVIIHTAMDDLKSQPVGNAGARVGCGVIGIAK